MRKFIILTFMLLQLITPAYAHEYKKFENQKFKASDAMFFSFFGVSMDMEQDTAIIGAQ